MSHLTPQNMWTMILCWLVMIVFYGWLHRLLILGFNLKIAVLEKLFQFFTFIVTIWSSQTSRFWRLVIFGEERKGHLILDIHTLSKCLKLNWCNCFRINWNVCSLIGKKNVICEFLMNHIGKAVEKVESNGWVFSWSVSFTVISVLCSRCGQRHSTAFEHSSFLGLLWEGRY